MKNFSSRSYFVFALTLLLVWDALYGDSIIRDKFLGRSGYIALISIVTYIYVNVICILVTAKLIHTKLSQSNLVNIDLVVFDGYKATGFDLQFSLISYFNLIQYKWDHEEQIKVKLANGAEMCRGLGRGRITSIQRVIIIKDIFGIIEYEVRGPKVDANIRISPALCEKAPIIAIDITAGGSGNLFQGGSAGDLTEQREYQVGDPINRVLWRVSDRLPDEDALVVRTHETTMNHNCSIYFDIQEGDNAAATMIMSNAYDLLRRATVYIMTKDDLELTQVQSSEQLESYLIERPSKCDASVSTMNDFVRKSIGIGINQLYIIGGSNFDQKECIHNLKNKPREIELNVLKVEFTSLEQDKPSIDIKVFS